MYKKLSEILIHRVYHRVNLNFITSAKDSAQSLWGLARVEWKWKFHLNVSIWKFQKLKLSMELLLKIPNQRDMTQPTNQDFLWKFQFLKFLIETFKWNFKAKMSIAVRFTRTFLSEYYKVFIKRFNKILLSAFHETLITFFPKLWMKFHLNLSRKFHWNF